MTPPRSRSGIGTRAGRVVLVVVWAAFAVATLARPDGPSWGRAIGFGLVLVALWFITAEIEEPIPIGLALTAVAIAAGAALTAATDRPSTTTFWLMSLVGYVYAFVVIRGRPRIGWACFAATWAAATVFILVRGATPELLTILRTNDGTLYWAPAALVLATAWYALLERSERRITRDRTELADAMMAEAEAYERIRVRAEQLSRVAREAGGVLQRVADGAPGPGDRNLARLIEARLRDRLRAPRLAVEPMASAANAARERGVEVLLLDDGDVDAPLGPENQALVLGALQDAAPGARVTVRLTPPDRAGTGTIVVIDGDRLERAELA